MYNPRPAAGTKRFVAYKRSNGETFKLGIIQAVNKVQADTRARYLFGKLLAANEAVWAEEDEELVA
jgi:hypothetical protein